MEKRRTYTSPVLAQLYATLASDIIGVVETGRVSRFVVVIYLYRREGVESGDRRGSICKNQKSEIKSGAPVLVLGLRGPRFTGTFLL